MTDLAALQTICSAKRRANLVVPGTAASVLTFGAGLVGTAQVQAQSMGCRDGTVLIGR